MSFGRGGVAEVIRQRKRIRSYLSVLILSLIHI